MTSKAVTSGNPNARTYTPEDVIQQSLVAFGQGTNFMRVNHEAAQYVVDVMKDTIDRMRVHETWETEAVQYLERVRAIGRVSALFATQKGQTAIGGEDVARATIMVQRTSKSPGCGDNVMTTSFPTSLD